ncbi:MAG TPA: hypothetical protein VHD58_02140 [Mycobacteriales bacterium]|nr:hypothetical protein [Mycobacteriales bacterium]
MRPAVTVTRRSILGAGLLFVAACKHPMAARHPAAADPDAAALAEARLTEQRLIAWYDDAIAVTAGQGVVAIAAARATHVAHLSALGGTAPATPMPTPTPVTTLGPSIQSLLESSAASLHDAAVGAVTGANAALLASICAAHTVSARVSAA